MFYGDYNFGGMHLIWWFLWVVILIWVFGTPYNIPGQRAKNDTPLNILKKRFASGQISSEAYLEQKRILED